MVSITSKLLVPPESVSDALVVRTEVFQKEQGIDREMDFDGKDNSSTHVVIYKNDAPIGTGRIRELNSDVVKIERVAVIKAHRGRGIGKLIMEEIDKYLSQKNYNKVTLDAQNSAKNFYEKLGYVQEGDVFEEVGIPHIIMSKTLPQLNLAD